MKRKVWDITVKDNPNRVVMGENDEFYTTDTEAYLVFNLDDKNFNPATAVLTLENRNDGSLKNETVDVVDGLIEWEMPQRYIEHFGNWQGQLVYEDTKDGQPELYTSAPFSFVVNAHIGDKKKPSLVEIENWEKFIRDGTELIETWEDLEALREENERQREANEEARQANYNELVNEGLLQSNIDQELANYEAEYAPRLTELEQNDENLTAQLAQITDYGEMKIVDDTEPSINYVGGWTNPTPQNNEYYNRTNHTSSTVGASIEYTFVGTGIMVYDSMFRARGIIEVFIDGVSQGTFDRYNKYILTRQNAYTALDLPYGEHTIKIVITGNKREEATDNLFIFDYFVVFNQPKTLAVKTAKRTLSPEVMENVFGLSGDGFTDDKTPIQTAVDYLNYYGGGTIELPRGDFRLESAIYIKSGVSLTGAGVGKTILKPYAETGGHPAINWGIGISDKNNPIVNCTFQGFEIDGIDILATKYEVAYKGMYIQYLRNCVFRDLMIRNTGATGLGIDYLDKCVIDNVSTDNCGRMWEDNGHWGGPGGAGIGIGTGGMPDENFTITNCVATNNGHYGIFVEDQIIFGLDEHYEPKGIVIANNIVKDGRWDGIGVKGGGHITIVGNTVYNNLHSGIAISHLAHDVMIGNNVVSENKFEDITIHDPSMKRIKVSQENIIWKKPEKITLEEDSLQYAKLPSNVGYFPSNDPFVIETGFKTTEKTVNQTILSKTDTNVTTGTSYPSGWTLRTDQLGRIMLEGYSGAGGTQYAKTFTYRVDLNRKTMIRLVWDGTEMSLYVSLDGVDYIKDTVDSAGNNTGNDIDLRNRMSIDSDVDTYIGRTWKGLNGYTYYLSGEVYPIRVWKGTIDTNSSPVNHFRYLIEGANNTVNDVVSEENGQAYNGASQEFWWKYIE